MERKPLTDACKQRSGTESDFLIGWQLDMSHNIPSQGLNCPSRAIMYQLFAGDAGKCGASPAGMICDYTETWRCFFLEERHYFLPVVRKGQRSFLGVGLF